MKRRTVGVFVVLVAVLLWSLACRCSTDREAGNVAPERISLAEAESLVRDWVFNANPHMNPSAELPLEEITTDEIWRRLSIQLFRLHSDFLGPSTYAIADSEIHVLGTSFGGYGVTHMEVTDLDLDGNLELTYTYSWGSGIHRSHIAVYLPRQTPPESIYGDLVYYHGDLILAKYADHEVVVEAGYYDWQRDIFVSQASLGAVSLVSIDGEQQVVVDLCDDLPSGITDRLSFP
jgi:hypothetical protein